MNYFKYCIWFQPEKNHEWFTVCDGFPAHMSICTKLEKEDIVEKESDIYIQSLQLNIPRKCKIDVEITGDIIVSEIDQFHALYYKVKIKDGIEKPDWWPDNPHVSFKYRYDSPFTQDEIDSLKDKIKKKDCCFSIIRVVNCNDNYVNWDKNK